MHSMKLGRMGQYLQITLSARGAIVQNGRCVCPAQAKCDRCKAAYLNDTQRLKVL